MPGIRLRRVARENDAKLGVYKFVPSDRQRRGEHGAGERGGAENIYIGSEGAENTKKRGVGSVWVQTGGAME